MEKFRSSISTLNSQQRRLFDDFTERMVSTDINEKPVYLFIAGEAGTGKSHLVQLLIEAVKIIKLKAGAELKKPPVIVMAPTANAAFIIGGKTIDSALGFSPIDVNRYTQAHPAKMAMMKFQYEDVQAIFCDEISMVGSMKLAKINFRLQDLADGMKKQEFMGGISFVASGKNQLS
jgi:ABC-type dipeptide/oligopeptide/nickel transport system ATPase component